MKVGNQTSISKIASVCRMMGLRVREFHLFEVTYIKFGKQDSDSVVPLGDEALSVVIHPFALE